MKSTQNHIRKDVRILLLATGLSFMILACNTKKQEQLSENLQIESVQLSPDALFHAALDAFAHKEYKKSSESIAKGIEGMNEIAGLVDSADRVNIKHSIAELNELKSKVLYDKVDGIEDLNKCFARAGKAIAGVHLKIVQKSYYNLEGKKAGSELRKAIDDIEKLEGYYRSGLDNEEIVFLSEMKEFAERLSTGRVTKAELDQHLSELSNRMLNSDLDLSVNFGENKKVDKTVVPAPKK